MAPSKPSKQEAVILIIDIRKNKLQQDGLDSVFLKAKECAKKIVLRRVIANSKDDVALIVLGSEHSNYNYIVEPDLSYENIEVIRDLEPPSWGMVEDIMAGQETFTECGGDILEAFVVAMSIMRKKGPLGYASRQIVLISHACGSSQFDGLDLIIEEMKRMKIEVTVIGPNVEDSQSQTSDVKMEEPLTEFSVVNRIASETGGLVCRLEDALEQLTNFKLKKVRPAAWKVGFEIGPDITIPVRAFLKISPVVDIKPKIVRMNDEDGSLVEKDYVFTVSSATTAEEKPVGKEEIIDGYHFGSTIVPFSDDEKTVLGYHSGPRSLKLLYFTPANSVPKHLFIGSGTNYIFPAGEKRSEAAFSALVHAMAAENVGAIARKVYNNNNNPTLLLLTPKITEEYDCLVAVTLPYANDVKHFSFRPLTTKKSQPSPEQLRAIDQLISLMDLMEVPDETGECTEAFAPESTLDPGQQHLYEVICERALNPQKKEIPRPSENVQKMLEPPAVFQERIQPVLERIKSLFPLEEKKLREGTRKAATDVFKQEGDFKADEVQQEKLTVQPSTIKQIGTLTPVLDFNRMLEEKQIPFKEVCGQMQDIIWKCVELAFDLDDMKKTVLFVQALRDVCVKQDPNIFNSWVTKLKSDLPRPKKSFLKLLVDENVALITQEESKLSPVSKEEAMALLCEEDAEMKEEPAENNDLDDLLNDM